MFIGNFGTLLHSTKFLISVTIASYLILFRFKCFNHHLYIWL